MPTPFFADLVRELAQEGGTGPLTPTGAVPGHRRFSGAVPPGVSFHYAIAGIAYPDQWEVGTGRIDGAGRLLRDTVAASSASGATVDFTPGLKTVALTVGADWFAASDTQAVALAGEVAGIGSEIASFAAALAAKQPLSTTHAGAGAGEATDAMTVRRGAGWVNLPLSALAFRDADGRYVLDGVLDMRRAVDGDMADIGKEGGQRLRIFVNADTIGLFNAASAGPGRDGLRIVDAAVAFDIAAGEVGRFTATGLGIGTDNPSARLDVRGASGTSVNIGNSDDSARGGRLSVTGAAASGALDIGTTSSGYSLTFSIDGTEAARIGTNRNFGVGVAPAHRLHVKSNAEIARFETTAARGSGNGFIGIADPGGRKGYFGYGGVNDAFYIVNQMSGNLVLGTNDQSWLTLDVTGNLTPGSDNGQILGWASARWSVIYAATGAINTSDAREKAWRGAAADAELRAARRIIAELGFYQWNDAIAEKGEGGARLHFGVRAQAVWAIMAAEGLIDPIEEGLAPSSRYAFLCHDRWDAVDPVEEVRDDDGSVIAAAAPGRPASDRFGVRPDQLALFLIAAQAARIAALEAAA